MGDLRCVRHDNVASILEATKLHDDGFMNLSTGPWYDLLRNTTTTDTSDAAYFFVLYRGDDLLLTLTNHAYAPTWQLMAPQSTEHLLTSSLIEDAARLLASTLLEVADPNAVSKVSGHEAAVNAFLEAWASLVETKGTHLRIAKPILATRTSYATRDSLAPLPDTPSSHLSITLSTAHDFEDIFPMYLDFLKTVGIGVRALDIEEDNLRRTIASGLLWICRAEGAIAGLTILGRITPRTIAIRNVYVSPGHRRKGVAGAMVSAMTRYHLGVQPVGYDGVPDEPPATGVKDIVCINVAEAAVERIYRRAGFLFPEEAEDGTLRGGRDPVSGLKAWLPTGWRGYEPQLAH